MRKHTLEGVNKYSDLKFKLYKYGDAHWEIIGGNSINEGKKKKIYISYVLLTWC